MAVQSFPLKQGSKGPYVLYLQNGLWISCINPNGRDGDFGAGTASAVRLFQSRYGLSVDGVVGTAMGKIKECYSTYSAVISKSRI